MAKTLKKLPLDNSEMALPTGKRRIRKIKGKQILRVTIVLKSSELPQDHPVARKVRRIHSSRSHRRPKLSQSEYEEYQCADDNHVEVVRRFAIAHGLEVVEVSRARHDVVLLGVASAICAAFQIDLKNVDLEHGTFRTHEGPIHVPAEIRDAVIGVFGLDNLQFETSRHSKNPTSRPPQGVTFSTQHFADYYCFPPGTTGKGQRIAIIELGGGYHKKDIDAYFKKLGIKPPEISDISISGEVYDPPAKNDPLDRETIRPILRTLSKNPKKAKEKYSPKQFTSLNDTLEVTMDLEIAASLAPGANIAMIFAPRTSQGLYEALYKAIEIDATVVSLSWGFVEKDMEGHKVHAINQVLHAAALSGITVCCASGDSGSRGTGVNDSNDLANVTFPASSPYVLACGGTALVLNQEMIEGEIVWNNSIHGTRLATGGGVSGLFKAPGYQRLTKVPRWDESSQGIWLGPQARNRTSERGRGVPDVAANADSDSSYRILLGGEEYQGFGTSAAAPLWAALIARLNEGLGRRLGWVNRDLYHPTVKLALRPIVHGHNDVSDGKIYFYRANSSWSGCTGLGTPDGLRLLDALRGKRG